MREVVDSRARTTRPWTLSLRPLELGLLARPHGDLLELAADHAQRLLEVLRPRPDVDADLAGVRRSRVWKLNTE